LAQASCNAPRGGYGVRYTNGEGGLCRKVRTIRASGPGRAWFVRTLRGWWTRQARPLRNTARTGNTSYQGNERLRRGHRGGRTRRAGGRSLHGPDEPENRGPGPGSPGWPAAEHRAGGGLPRLRVDPRL